MFSNNKSCFQLNLYGISNFLSFKIIFYSGYPLFFTRYFILVTRHFESSLWISLRVLLLCDFAVHISCFTNIRKRQVGFETVIPIGHRHKVEKWNGNAEMTMSKTLKYRRERFPLFRRWHFCVSLVTNNEAQTNKLLSLFNPFHVIKIFWKRFLYYSVKQTTVGCINVYN